MRIIIDLYVGTWAFLVKAVIAKFDNPYEPASSRYITEKEFLQCLDEMAENNRDSISPQEIERIKQQFSK